MARRHSKLFVFAVNGAFILGILLFVGGCSGLVFALGWYNLGPQMEDRHKWVHSTCAVTASRVAVQNNPYSSQHRYRAEFAVNFPLPDSNATFIGAVATVTLDSSWWASQASADRDVARYPVGNRTECFCPVEPNLWAVPEQWTIYRFCLFRFTQADVDHLLDYYHAWFYSGLVALALAALLMGIPSIIWHRTKCFRRAMRPCRSGPYELVN